ncbi:MAG: serine/threonine protein kinase, partial [Cyanobacteria bacterium P01_D01_bin.36]
MLINNRYQVIRPLGEGGFGHAYLAEDTQMPSRRKCVIKQLKPITTSPEVYQVVQDRFQREAAILEQLGDNHSQIPRLYAYFTENQKFYLVQEWIEGETLEDVTIPLPEAAVTSIIADLLPVLDFIHKRGIIHRDLKPENIILRGDTGQSSGQSSGQFSGQPVLIDFGAVRETMGTVMNSRNHPTSSIVIGTPGYMSAEQAAGRPIPSSDLYSLGLTAIYLLTGQMPQSLQIEPQTGEVLWQQMASHVSVGLRALLDRAVRSHPRDRYSTASEMLQALSMLPGTSIRVPSPADRHPQNLPQTVIPSQPPASTPGVSEMQTMAVAAVPASTHQQSSATAANTVVTGNSLLNGGVTNSSRSGAKGLMPLTIGLGVLLIGGGALGIGMLMGQNSVDSTTVSSRSEGSEVSSIESSSAEEDTSTIEPPDEQTPTKEETKTAPQPAPPAPEIVTGPVIVGESQQVTLGGTSTGQIDVYEQPSFLAASPSYGVTGESVLATGETVRAETGLVWYGVRFDSGVEGWIPESSIVSFGSTEPVEPPPAVDPPTPEEILAN